MDSSIHEEELSDEDRDREEREEGEEEAGVQHTDHPASGLLGRSDGPLRCEFELCLELYTILCGMCVG